MQERLHKLLGGKADFINIHTFHSLCFSILKKHYNADITVMTEQEKALCKNEILLKNAVSFDELITLGVKLFEENPAILQEYRETFKYVFVDEYQDIDENQYKLIKLLVPPTGNIFAIGDQNQAIYGFRGGGIQNFSTISKRIIPKLKLLTCETTIALQTVLLMHPTR